MTLPTSVRIEGTSPAFLGAADEDGGILGNPEQAPDILLVRRRPGNRVLFSTLGADKHEPLGSVRLAGVEPTDKGSTCHDGRLFPPVALPRTIRGQAPVKLPLWQLAATR